MKLNEATIRNARPREKAYKLADGAGLHLLVQTTGSKLWRLRYRYAGKENMLGLGRYPEVGLRKARARAFECRSMLAGGRDPAAARLVERENREETFGGIADEWLAKMGTPSKRGARPQLKGSTMKKARGEFSKLEPLKRRPIREITPADLLRELRKIEARGTIDTAHRVKQRASQVYRYAVATGRADHDITSSLLGALPPVRGKNHPALTRPDDVAGLLRAIDGYQGQPSVMFALRIAPLVFVRPGELRGAEWVEFALEGESPEWRIPAQRMKMDAQHIVPLSRQAVALLKELAPHTGHGRFLFPSLRTAERCISDGTINAALRRLDYSKDEQTAHGFRTIASTLLNEMGWHPDVIELQLAHAPRDKVRAAYNRAERLPERRKMMQAWADYLDGLKAGAKVTAIRGAAG